MPKAVLFDLDGVLTTDKTGSQSTLRSLAYHTGLPEETLCAAYYRHNRALLSGSTTHAEIWPELCAEVGREIDLALLHTAFIETPMDGAMLMLAREMKAQGCLIALVTDNKADRVHAILAHHGLHDLFDAVAISAEVGSGKGERAIFDAVLTRLGVAAEDCAFIDNTAKNLTVPQAMGMQTILFDDEARDVDGLRATLTQPIYSRCGMRCDLCHLYRPNVARDDRRAEVCAVYAKIWPGFKPDPAEVICDGCACDAEGAALFSPDCPARQCVKARGIPHCGYCREYPCPDYPAEPTPEELVQAIDVEKRWTWEEERLMSAYRCRAYMDAWRKAHGR